MSPRPVFTASLLLSGAAALWMAWAVGALFGLPQFIRIYLIDHQGGGNPAVVTIWYVVLATLATVIGLVVVLLAVLNARGARMARVFTWILAVPAVFVALWCLLGGGSDNTTWWVLLTRGTGGLTLLMVVAAMALLCRPAARAHFIKGSGRVVGGGAGRRRDPVQP